LDSNIPPSQRAADGPADSASRVVLIYIDQKFVFFEEMHIREHTTKFSTISCSSRNLSFEPEGFNMET